MNFIGSLSKNCETLRIFKEGSDTSISLIQVFYDDTGVRSLYMRLTNGDLYRYGNLNVAELKEIEFDFHKGSQMLGIYGKVGFDGKSERLLTLGFFKDDCSAMKNLYVPAKDRKVVGALLNVRQNGEINFIAVFIVLSILFVLACITLIYVCLKNRGKICKKRSQIPATF